MAAKSFSYPNTFGLNKNKYNCRLYTNPPLSQETTHNKAQDYTE